MSQDLAIAYAVKRKNMKKMASGGEVMPVQKEESPFNNPQSVVSKIMERKMNKGGMCYSEGGEVDGLEEDTSDDEDLDLDLDMPEESHEDKRKAILRRIMSELR